VREDTPGMQRIVLYVTPSRAEVESVLQMCKEHLPHYMVPSAVVTLESWPRTGSGKIDRKALPAPTDGGGEGGEAVFVAAATALEASLADAFQAVLGLQSAVSTSASFFDLGGNSLAAVRLVHLIRAGTSSVSLRDVFANPSVCGLAAAIESLTSDGTGTDRPGVVVLGGASTPVPGAVVFDGGPAVGNCVRFAIQLLAVIFIKLIYSAALFPLLLLVHKVHLFYGIKVACAAAPAIVALCPFTAFVFVFGLKWIVVGRLTPGRYRLWSCVFLRWWFLERLLRLLEGLAVRGPSSPRPVSRPSIAPPLSPVTARLCAGADTSHSDLESYARDARRQNWSKRRADTRYSE
jgi:hypothetical protein